MNVNFVRQLDWALGCPDTWSNITLGVSMRLFLDEVRISISGLSRADCLLPDVGGPALSSGRPR